MYCQNCGAQFDGNFCPNCGTPGEAGDRHPRQGPRSGAQNNKKPLVKKWWFWALIGAVVFSVGVSFLIPYPYPKNSVGLFADTANKARLIQAKAEEAEQAAETQQLKPIEVQPPDAPSYLPPSGGGSNAAEPLAIGETVLFDQDGIRAVATGITEDGWFGPEINILVENNTDRKIVVQSRNFSVNGAMINTILSCDVEAGKKANESIALYQESLDKAGIYSIQSIELKIVAMDAESWDTIAEGKNATIRTNAPAQEQAFDDSGFLALDQDGVRLVVRGVDQDANPFGKNVEIFLENHSGNDITVQLRDVSVNGYMIDPFFTCDLPDGKVAYSDASFFTTDLEANNIKDLQTLKFSVAVLDMTDWQWIFKSDPVEVTLS